MALSFLENYGLFPKELLLFSGLSFEGLGKSRLADFPNPFSSLVLSIISQIFFTEICEFPRERLFIFSKKGYYARELIF
ncbi:hypothetical protein E7T04_13200 [Enterococcus faecalis]|nr:hypothetical protein E7T04_13200 [Enterococcus faecalis]